LAEPAEASSGTTSIPFDGLRERGAVIKTQKTFALVLRLNIDINASATLYQNMLIISEGNQTDHLSAK